MNHKDALAAVEGDRPTNLTWAGKPVMNLESLLAALEHKVQSGRLSETCNLCCEERPLAALTSACGHCTSLACGTCLTHWYGQLSPGRLYVPSEGLCAFCKRVPKARVLRQFNRAASRLSGRRKLVLDAGHYYGWCRTCFKVKPALPRECAQETPQLQNWECEDCAEQRQLAESTDLSSLGARNCPGCEVPTVKISGCNHITCPCNTHWCWNCSKAFAEDIIYEHMDECGGDYMSDWDEEDE